MSWIAVGGLAVAAGSAVVSGIQKGKANKALTKLAAQDAQYKKSQFAQQQYSQAQQLFNGRMFGAADQEKNIGVNQANAVNNVNRSATDSSQALAIGSLAQGQSNDAFNNLSMSEQRNKYSLLGNLNSAYGAMTGQDENLYNDQVRQFGNQAQILGAKSQNNQTATQDAINAAMAAYNVWAVNKGGVKK